MRRLIPWVLKQIASAIAMMNRDNLDYQSTLYLLFTVVVSVCAARSPPSLDVFHEFVSFYFHCLFWLSERYFLRVKNSLSFSLLVADEISSRKRTETLESSDVVVLCKVYRENPSSPLMEIVIKV